MTRVNRETAIPVDEAVEEQVPQRRFRPYSEYRDSGVEWLGLVPAHWKTDRLKWTVTMCRNGIWGDEPDGVYDVTCVRVADFDRTSYRVRLEEPTLRAVTPSQRKGRLLREGDLLLEKSGGGELQPVGAVMLFDHDVEAVCSNFVARMPVATGFDGRLLAYFHAHLYSGRVNTRSIKQTTGIQNLDSYSYLNEHVPYIPLPEQWAIAGFLDRETGRIDELIAKKQRLIELLAEKRTALISHAVTKGLNSNVPMKDSGVEWFDAIPSNWTVTPLKYIVPDVTVGIVITPARYYVHSGVPCLRSLNVSSGAIAGSDFVYISPESNELHRKSKIYSDDIVVVRTGRTGIAAIVTDEFDGANCIDLVIIRRSSRVLTKYLHYFINAAPAVRQVETLSVGSLQAHYNTSTVKQLVIPNPPIDEQRYLIAYLDDQTGQLDGLIGHIQSGLDALREYHSALISAAVTGKIDVRKEGC